MLCKFTLNSNKICTYLWDEKRLLSYPLTTSGSARTVLVVTPLFSISREEFLSHLGLSVTVSSMFDSDINSDYIGHLQQAMIQCARSILLLDEWFLFTKPGADETYGTLAR